MKKFLSAIVCAAAVAMSGCSLVSEEEQRSINHSIWESRSESSSIEESIAREAEIEEIDEWGVSLDDVDRLAKEAIRRHDNILDYKSDYRKAVRVTDEFLEDIREGKETEGGWQDFFENYKKSCEAGIEYIKSAVDVEFFYNMVSKRDEPSRSDMDYIRTLLEIYNRTIKSVEESAADMEDLMNPIIAEEREPTEDELEKIYEFYQVLVDKVYTVDKNN